MNKIRLICLVIFVSIILSVNTANAEDLIHLKCNVTKMENVKNGTSVSVVITQNGKWKGHMYTFTLSKGDVYEWKRELKNEFNKFLVRYIHEHKHISKTMYKRMKRKYTLSKGNGYYVLLDKNGTKKVTDDKFVNIYKLIKL